MHLDEPLSDKEFNELDKFLMSDRVGDDGMTMDALHGYLTAIALGPESIPMLEWLPLVWGLPDQAEPKFKNEKELQRISNLIARFMNEIQITFEVAPQEFEPLFCVGTKYIFDLPYQYLPLIPFWLQLHLYFENL